MRLDGSEFERTALPHAGSLLRFALRLTHDPAAAEDLVQETLLLAWRGFGQFAAGGNLRAWLFRILMNAFHAQHRKAHSSARPVEPSPELTAMPDAVFERLEITQALDRLAPDRRAVLLLAAVEGFTCREISEILAVPIGTVMSRLSRAREAMREALSAPARPGQEVAR